MYYMYAIKSKIFFSKPLFLRGVLLDLDKYIFSW